MCGAKIPDDAEFCNSCGTKNDVIKMSFGNGLYEKKDNSTPGKVIIVRYNSYTKEFRYRYSSNGIDYCPIADNVLAELNPIKWSQLDEIVSKLKSHESYLDNGCLTILFQGSEEDFIKLEHVCNALGCSVFYDKSNTIASSASLYNHLYSEIENAMNEIEDDDIKNHLCNVLDTARINDDKANACKALGDAFLYCYEHLKNNKSSNKGRTTNAEVTFDKGNSSQLINKKEYKWQDLKSIKDKKYENPEKLMDDLTNIMMDDLKTDTFNYFVTRLTKGTYFNNSYSFLLTIPPILPGNINTNQLKKLYVTSFDQTISNTIKEYINTKLELRIGSVSKKIHKAGQASRMKRIMESLKREYFDKLADLFMSCVEELLGANSSSDMLNIEYSDAIVRKYETLYENFKEKVTFKN